MSSDIKTKSITLVLTHQCNLACTYCYEKHKDNQRMSLETAKSIIDKELTQDDGTTDVEIDLFGGEPLLEFPLVKSLVEYAKSKDYPKEYVFFITTNGVLLNDERKEWLKENTNYLQMGLSLDGTKAMHDTNRNNSYDKIDIDFFAKTYPSQGIKMTISKETLPYLAEGIINCHNLGFEDVNANLAYGIDWTDPENEKIYERELLKLVDFYIAHPELDPCSILDINRLKSLTNEQNEATRHCGAGVYMKAYDYDGTFYPCQHFLPLSIGQDKAFNSLKIDFRKSATDIDSFSEECRTCKMKNVCPTCYGENYSMTGDINKRDMTLCRLFKIQFKSLAYFVSKLFENNRLDDLDVSSKVLILKAALVINNEISL